VLLDGVTHVVDESTPTNELQQLLYKLVVRFKRLDVTSLLTTESKSLYFRDEITERGFSPVADNLLMLRYVVDGKGNLSPAIRIVKTRGSSHDRGTHGFDLDKGGIRITEERPKATASTAPSKPSKRSFSALKPRSKERLR
jgi:circadian clock protein KaiC